MRNWDPLAILKYLTGIIPQHACIFIFMLDKRIWEDASLNPNFPSQDAMEMKKSVLQLMFVAHLSVFFIQFFYDTGLIRGILSCCFKPKSKTTAEDGTINETLLEGEDALEYEITHLSVIGPSLSTFVQICLYQGVITVELN